MMLELFEACRSWSPSSITIHHDKSFSARVIFKFDEEEDMDRFMEILEKDEYDETAFIEDSWEGSHWELDIDLCPQTDEQKREVLACVGMMVRGFVSKWMTGV
jgi:hypothetical protein